MIALFNDGIGSFKVELEKDEYYFDVDGDLRPKSFRQYTSIQFQ